jgi:hypothetical protein
MTVDAQYMMGQDAVLNIDKEGAMIHRLPSEKQELPTTENRDLPTEEEKHSLRRVPGNVPIVAYIICAVEFAERASYVPLLLSHVSTRRLTRPGQPKF